MYAAGTTGQRPSGTTIQNPNSAAPALPDSASPHTGALAISNVNQEHATTIRTKPRRTGHQDAVLVHSVSSRRRWAFPAQSASRRVEQGHSTQGVP
jgi:hypothetical protein